MKNLKRNNLFKAIKNQLTCDEKYHFEAELYDPTSCKKIDRKTFIPKGLIEKCLVLKVFLFINLEIILNIGVFQKLSKCFQRGILTLTGISVREMIKVTRVKQF